MASRRAKSRNTLGTRLNELDRKVEVADTRSKLSDVDTDKLVAEVAALQEQVASLSSPNYRIEQAYDHLTDRFPVLDDGGTGHDLPDRLGESGMQVLDWNSASTAGFYWSAAEALNAPLDDLIAGYVVVSNGRLVQVVYDPTEPDKEFRRAYNGNDWTEWVEAGVGPEPGVKHAPKIPANFRVVSNEGVWTPEGSGISRITLAWDHVTQNVENQTISIEKYEIWSRRDLEFPSLAFTTSDNSITTDIWLPGDTQYAMIRVLSADGLWSNWSPVLEITPATPPAITPKAPTGVHVESNEGAFLETGAARSTVTVAWDAVTQSVDDQTVGVSEYEVRVGMDVSRTTETEHTFTMQSNATTTVFVRAMSKLGVWGGFSSSLEVTGAMPLPVLTAPTDPTLTTRLGAVNVAWDGALTSGPPPAGFAYVRIQGSVSPAGPWQTVGSPLAKAGDGTVSGVSGEEMWFRLVAVDTVGRSGPPSDVESITVVGITIPDLEVDLSGAVTAAVKEYIDEYAVNSSSTVPPAVGSPLWSTDTPTWEAGKYVWRRARAIHVDDSESLGNPALMTGNPGEEGAQGPAGADGRGIVATTVEYKLSASGTVEPTGTWQADPPAVPQGQYLWTRTTISYSSGPNSISYSVGRMGSDGSDGDDGQSSYLHVAYANSADGTIDFDPSDPTGRTYLGTYTDSTSTDSGDPGDYSWSLIKGSDGVGITSSEVHYAVSSSGTSTPSSGWNSNVLSTTTGQFLWTRTTVHFSDNAEQVSYSVAAHGATGSQGIQGPPGEDGTQYYTWIKYADTPTSGMSDLPDGKTYMGIANNMLTPTESETFSDYKWSLIKGTDGKGISSTQVTYVKSTDGVTAPGEGAGWVASPIPQTGPGEFLWTRTKTTYTDSSTSTAYSVAAHGATGNTGATGRGISTTSVTYAKSSNGTTSPASGWVTSPIPSTTPGEFLWTRTVITYTSGSPASTESFSVAAHGQTGQQGIPGEPGADGEPTYTWIKYATSASGAGMSDDPTGKTHIGIAYNKPTDVESVLPGDYAWSLIQGPQGATGATGATGRGIASTAVTYQVHSSGTGSGPTGTWHSTPQATSPGQFLWTKTTVNYTTGTPSSTNFFSVAAHGTTGATGATGVSVTGVTRFFQLASSPPAKPANSVVTPPSPWQTTEPAYVAGETRNLYYIDRANFSNSTRSYSNVMLSSTYESARLAYERANLAIVSGRSYTRSMSDASDIQVANGPAPTVVDSPDAPGGKALQKSGTGSGWWVDLRGKRPYDPLVMYRLTVTMRVTTNGSTGGVYYIGLQGWGADGTTLVNSTGTNTTSSQHYLVSSASHDYDDGTWFTAYGFARGLSTGNTAGGNDVSDPKRLHKDVRWIAPLVITDYSNGNHVVEIGSIDLDVISPEAYIGLELAQLTEQTVDGLNKIHYAEIATPPTAHATGDLWFVVDLEESKVSGVRSWNGSDWVPYRLVADSVIVPGSVGTTTIGENGVTTFNIASKAVTAEQVATNTLTANEMSPSIGNQIKINGDLTIQAAFNEMNADLTKQRNRYRFSDDYLSIGTVTGVDESPGPNELRLFSDGIEMHLGSEKVSWWKAGKFVAPQSRMAKPVLANHIFERVGENDTIIALKPSGEYTDD